MKHWTDRWASRFASTVKRTAASILDQMKADFYEEEIEESRPILHPRLHSRAMARTTLVPLRASFSWVQFHLLAFKSLAMAEQLTLIDATLFNRIHWIEILNWSHELPCPNLDRSIDHFNKVSHVSCVMCQE